MEKEEIINFWTIGYKAGYLLGMNTERRIRGEKEFTKEEFNDTLDAKILDAAISIALENVIKEFDL